MMNFLLKYFEFLDNSLAVQIVSKTYPEGCTLKNRLNHFAPLSKFSLQG